MKSLLILILLVLISVKSANATNLRGKVVRLVNRRSVPLAGTRVDLLFWAGGKWNNAGYALTGADGFYFFVNQSPGSTFCVLILGRYYPATPLIIKKIAPPNYQDLPLIVN